MTSPLLSKSPITETDRQFPSAEKLCGRIVQTVSVLVFLIAFSNLAPWWIESARFFASWPGAMIMRVNSGIALTCLAVSLYLWHLAPKQGPHWLRAAASLLAVIAAAIGGLTSLEYFIHADLGIDTLFAAASFPEDAANRYVAVPGRMSLNAALSFFFLGLALAGLDWGIQVKQGRRLLTAPILAVVSALPASFALVGYLSGTSGFTGLLKSTNILLHVALSLVLVAIGILALRSERQPVQRLLSQGAGGTLLRWLLPGSTVSLIFLAWLIGKGRSWGMVAPGEGTAFMLFGGLILLYGLIVSASRAVSVQETRVRRAKFALREEEQRSRSILKTSLDGVLLVDITGRILDWNQAAERIFGWRRDEVIGRPLADLIVPERLRPDYHQRLKNYLPNREGTLLGRRLELPALRRDGSEFPVEVSVNAVADADPPLFVGFVRDITHRQKAERALREAKEQAEKASQAKDEFLAALSHELRTPLTPVLLTSSALSQDPRLPVDVRQSLEMIDRNVSLEARLIDDLLDLTRISSGKLRLRSEPCDIAELIHHTLVIIREDAQTKGVQIDLHLDAQHRQLTGDSARLQQVFWNLLKNAVKFTPNGGTITISSRYEDSSQTLMIEVRDTGVGFEPERADQLFLPFEQEKFDSAHQFGGLGLGLAIARAIVTLHHGRISASSPGPGFGSVFTVTLPGRTTEAVSSAAIPPAVSPTAAISTATIQSLRILLVEDHAPTRQVLEQLLKRAGHTVVTAASVAEALEIILAYPAPEILISDVGLPDGTGLDLLKELRARGLTLPGIALSGYGMEEDHQRTREAGFSMHLVKPVKFAQLQQALSEIRLGQE